MAWFAVLIFMVFLVLGIHLSIICLISHTYEEKDIVRLILGGFLSILCYVVAGFVLWIWAFERI